jgi:uncharacterized RmlC-like cupin family protein
MAASDPVQHVPPSARTEGDTTPGMTREQAIAIDGMWSGITRTAPGAVSGWHHHGAYDSTIFVVSGQLRMESGPAGGEVIEAGPGDFLLVPRGAVHREGNPGAEASEIVVVRAGRGEPVFNVDGPAAPG